MKQFLVYLTFTFYMTIKGDLQYTLLEEKPEGFFIGKISDNVDLPLILRDNAIESLRYSFLTQGYPHSDFFNLTKDGRLYTSKQLDREDLCGFMDTCILEAEIAIQSTVNQFFRKEKLNVILQDVNDHSPTFSRDSIALKISEAVSVNSSFILESALDRDVGENSLQGYNLVSETDNFGIHVIKTLDGGTVVSLVVLRPLDHEERNFYEIVIVAKDGANPPRTGSLSANISVVDINDNPPMFSALKYNATVNESALVNKFVTQVSATDLDSGINGVSLYRFSPLVPRKVQRYFNLDKISGKITVSKSLHPIQGQVMQFIVECLDGGSPPLVAQAEVTIHVEDSTNSPPSINLNLFENSEISENASPGMTVGHVAVLDPDSDQNGLVRCFLVSDSFNIQGLGLNEYRIIVTEKLDREKTAVHNLVLTCKDAGKPQLNDTISFKIKIRDENDHAPVFQQIEYSGNISENTSPGQLILKVAAADKDQGENSRITYLITKSDELGIKIDENGQIISDRVFDRENKSKITFEVIARDNGYPVQSASCSVTIFVMDVNDVRPTFKKPRYLFQTKENQISGTIIGRIHAEDADDGLNGEILYSIQLRFEELEYYPIKVTSEGTIKTTFPLDREIKSRYEFSVIASDRGTPSLSSSVEVVVDVSDQNDHAPVIVSPSSTNHSLSVPFHMHTNYALFTVIAKDKDEAANAHIEFLLSPEDGYGMLKIEPKSGVIRLSRFLTPNDIGLFGLDVIVRDFGQPSLNSSVDFNITIYQTNETNAYLERIGPGSEDNVMIVLILGSVTGIIFILVILIIFIIRRSDRANQKFLNANVVRHMETSNLKPDFTITEFDDPTEVNQKNHSWDKLNNKLSFTDDLVSLSDISHDQSFAKNRKRVSGELTEALKKHEALLKSYGVSTKVPIQVRLERAPLPCKHQEETGSHTSADTSTNDSGRGGSDDEGNLSRYTNAEMPPENRDMAPRTRMSCDLSTFKQPLRPLPELGNRNNLTQSQKPSTVLINQYVPNSDRESNLNNKRVQFNVANKTWLTTSGSDPKIARHRCHGNLSNAKNDVESCDSEVDSIISDVHSDGNGMFEINRQKADDVYV